MLEKYSFGIGDRFAKEGLAQLQAFLKAKEAGVVITPVWNKSFREHSTVGSSPESVRHEADKSVQALDWPHGYLVDADHITFETVGKFIPYSDFFTIDVAAQIGQPMEAAEKDAFLLEFRKHIGKVEIDGISAGFELSEDELLRLGNRFYKACKEARRIYGEITKWKQAPFAVEVSMDEVDAPQSPMELYFILVLLSHEGVPVNTIAPKFSGRFNKGVDYEGEVAAFEREFEEDLLVIRHCVARFNIPSDLKLSIHTGSDKFSLYPVMNRLVKKYACGLHVKTAGTTWLEELIGLAESEGTGLEMAKSIYSEAYTRFDELTIPYENVIDVRKEDLPSPNEVAAWNGEKYSETLRHDQSNAHYNPNFRQLLHTSYKLAAERGNAFLSELVKNSEHIGRNVTENLFDRHIKPLFL